MAEALVMRRDLTLPFAEPSWPDGISLVLFSESMAEELHALLETGYAKGEGECPSFAAWWKGLTGNPQYDTELIFVAQAADGQLVGLAQCWNSGFLRDVVVKPGWRRRGIGEALLLRAFAAVKNRYHTTMDHRVRSSNLAAIRLYRRMGFAVLQ